MKKVYVKGANVGDVCLWVHNNALEFKAGGAVVPEGKSDGASLYELDSGDVIDFLPDNTAELEGKKIGTWETPPWPKDSCVITPNLSS